MEFVGAIVLGCLSFFLIDKAKDEIVIVIYVLTFLITAVSLIILRFIDLAKPNILIISDSNYLRFNKACKYEMPPFVKLAENDNFLSILIKDIECIEYSLNSKAQIKIGGIRPHLSSAVNPGYIKVILSRFEVKIYIPKPKDACKLIEEHLMLK